MLTGFSLSSWLTSQDGPSVLPDNSVSKAPRRLFLETSHTLSPFSAGKSGTSFTEKTNNQKVTSTFTYCMFPYLNGSSGYPHGFRSLLNCHLFRRVFPNYNQKQHSLFPIKLNFSSQHDTDICIVSYPVLDPHMMLLRFYLSCSQNSIWKKPSTKGKGSILYGKIYS